MQTAIRSLRESPRTWTLTGAAGFIGSNLLEALLRLDQKVIGLDDFSTGSRSNLDEVKTLVTPEQWSRFKFLEGDIRSLEACREVCRGTELVLHQAALGSVPRSIEDPLRTHDVNITGTLNMMVAARDEKVRSFVFAASSSTYGDLEGLPKVEDRIGKPLSPYAVTKLVNEVYADVFHRVYGFDTIGLRYFNVFGPRQDPNGAYAAVIPLWIKSLIRGETVAINGDGMTSRDFCFVDNVVQANLLAALATAPEARNQVYNVALNAQTSLNELYEILRSSLEADHPHLKEAKPLHRDFRKGDVRHSRADIGKAQRLLGYQPTHTIRQGLAEALDWYKRNL